MGASPLNPPSMPAVQPTGIEVLFSTRTLVSPPASIFVTKDDQIQFRFWSSFANYTINIASRILTPDGRIVPRVDQIITDASRVAQTVFFQPGEGFILSFEVWVTGGAIHRAQVFCQANLVRGGQNAPFTYVGQLVQGYADAQNYLAWPSGVNENSVNGQGNLRSITGTLPGAGIDITEIVPSGARWRVVSFTFSLTTSATVANRFVHMIIDDGSHVLYNKPSQAAQVASFGQTYVAATGDRDLVNSDGVYNFSLGPSFVIPALSRIRTFTNGLQVGDQFTAPQYLVEEWLAT